MYYAGISSTDITPPVGYLLQGHGARNQPSQMVHDPLFLKALTVSDGQSRVALITSDLVYFSKEHIAAIKNDIALRTELPPERVLITAAHTHTGPYTFSSQPDDERLLPDYLSLLQKKAVGAVIEAINREEPAILRWGECRVNIGAINRRRKDAAGRTQMAPNANRPIDPQATVLAACTQTGHPIAILCNYTCHPTVIATDIYQISADYPGAFQRVMQQNYPGAVAMFTNGCCGDIRPAIIDRTTGQFKGGSFDDAERMGRILAGAAITAFEQSAELAPGEVAGALEHLALPLNKNLLPTDEQRLDQAFKTHKKSLTSHDGNSLEKWRDYWQKKLNDGDPVPDTVPIDIQALRFGSAHIAGIAGETMVEIGLRIKEATARKNLRLMLCGDANGVIGYIPTSEALGDGGYEANSFIHKFYAAPYSPKMEDALVDGVLALLEKC